MALKVYKYSSCGVEPDTVKAAACHFRISAKGVGNAWCSEAIYIFLIRYPVIPQWAISYHATLDCHCLIYTLI